MDYKNEQEFFQAQGMLDEFIEDSILDLPVVDVREYNKIVNIAEEEQLSNEENS